VASDGGGRQLTVREGGRGTGGHWGAVDGAGGQPMKLDGRRCLAARE
jgi:hypothetical protein